MAEARGILELGELVIELDTCEETVPLEAFLLEIDIIPATIDFIAPVGNGHAVTVLTTILVTVARVGQISPAPDPAVDSAVLLPSRFPVLVARGTLAK